MERRQPSSHTPAGGQEPKKVGSLCVSGVFEEKTNTGADLQSKSSENKINEVNDTKTYELPSHPNGNIFEVHLNTKKSNCHMREGINELVDKDSNGIHSGREQVDQTCAGRSSAEYLKDKDVGESILHHTRPGYITKPIFRPSSQSRRRKLAIVQPPKVNKHELVEIQEIRVEKGTIQIVRDEERSSSEAMNNMRIPQIPNVSKYEDHSQQITDNLSAYSKEILQRNEERKKSDPGPQKTRSKDVHACLIEQSLAGENYDHFDEDFLPRIRSRSMDESRATQKIMEENRLKKHNDRRRKSFEVWLTDKEKQIIKDMNIKALKKKQEFEKEAKRKHQHRGKSYEEWLKEKSREKTKEHGWIDLRDQELDEAERRRRMSQDRYDKWLFEKEIEALRKEQDRLKEVEKKAKEMRKKWIERNGMAKSKNPSVSH